MRLTTFGADALLDLFAGQLNAGRIVIVDGDRELVRVPFSDPAFQMAQNQFAIAEVSPAMIAQSGTARLAHLETASGDLLATAIVRAIGDPNAETGDVLLDRLDFHVGGLCELVRVTLTLPLRT